MVISDPPYGMKAGGHTPFNCDMEKCKSMVQEVKSVNDLQIAFAIS